MAYDSVNNGNGCDYIFRLICVMPIYPKTFPASHILTLNKTVKQQLFSY